MLWPEVVGVVASGCGIYGEVIGDMGEVVVEVVGAEFIASDEFARNGSTIEAISVGLYHDAEFWFALVLNGLAVAAISVGSIDVPEFAPKEPNEPKEFRLEYPNVPS